MMLADTEIGRLRPASKRRNGKNCYYSSQKTNGSAHGNLLALSSKFN
jgi:hypothetical protein